MCQTKSEYMHKSVALIIVVVIASSTLEEK